MPSLVAPEDCVPMRPAPLARSAVAVLALCLLAADPPAEMPAGLRGTWLLRLTSDDSGKTYRSGDGKPVCEVSATTVRFLRKVPFAAENLTITRVATSAEANGTPAHRITFADGTSWKITQVPPSITIQVYGRPAEAERETYRLVVRLQK